MKAKERTFVPGDRVRVYGNSQTGKIQDVPSDGWKATVYGPCFGAAGWINVTKDGASETCSVHERQCVRLVRKPQKAPVRWEGHVTDLKHKWVKAVEIRPGEVIASQATVTKLIKDLCYEEGSLGAQMIRDALGLEPK